MDNKFLYRGKKISTGEWVYGNIIERANGSLIIVSDFLEDICVVDPSAVGQCTGLHAAKSCRGKSEADRLIFEGDVVNTPFKRVKAEWSEAYKRWFFVSIDTLRVLEPGRDFNGYEVEIIGNIHDTPELLET